MRVSVRLSEALDNDYRWNVGDLHLLWLRGIIFYGLSASSIEIDT